MSEEKRLQQRVHDLEGDLRRVRGDLLAARVRIQTLTEQNISLQREAEKMRNAWEVERLEAARNRAGWGEEEG